MDFSHIAQALASMPRTAMSPRHPACETSRQGGVRGSIRRLYAGSPHLVMQSHQLARRFNAPLHSVMTHLCALRREGYLAKLHGWRSTGKPWGSLRAAFKGKRQQLHTLFTADPQAWLTSDGIAADLDCSLNYARSALAQLRRAGMVQVCVIWVRAA
jgi:hypothetical protein